MSRPVAAPEWSDLVVAGARVRLLAAGCGEPVLFLHGWGLGPASYGAGIARLAAEGVRVLAPALPGFGGSDGPPLRGVTLDTYADRVAALLDALAPGAPVAVVGHSFGGGIAIRLASRRPDLVRSLVLVDSVGGAPGPGRSRRVGDVRVGVAGPSWAARAAWWRDCLAEVAPRELARTLPPSARDLASALLRRPVTTALAGLVALRAALADEAQDLADAGVPLLLVWGDGDRLVPPGQLGEVAGAGVADAAVVPGRHGWLLAEPVRFAALVAAGLAEHARAERRLRGLPAAAGDLGAVLPVERRRRARHGAEAPVPARRTAGEVVG